MNVEDNTLRICGIEFEPSAGQSITARQDNYLMGQLRLAGVLDVVQSMKDADVDEKSSELLTRILVSGRAPEVLAGLLVERGKTWNIRRAEKLAELFGDATNPEDKEIMRKSIVSFVIGFFRFGDRSSTSSPKSSVPNDAELPIEREEASISETSPA